MSTIHSLFNKINQFSLPHFYCRSELQACRTVPQAQFNVMADQQSRGFVFSQTGAAFVGDNIIVSASAKDIPKEIATDISNLEDPISISGPVFRATNTTVNPSPASTDRSETTPDSLARFLREAQTVRDAGARAYSRTGAAFAVNRSVVDLSPASAAKPSVSELQNQPSVADMHQARSSSNEQGIDVLLIPSSAIVIERGTLLGRGATADVYAGSWAGKDVAVKVFRIKIGELKEEAELLHRVQDKGFVKIFGYSAEESESEHLLRSL